ncbi:hypothetical protein HMI54_001040 [Coelomomyces lativittatus]|nr:hypothetical protein HMI54_001040 [Coelomomyces lativittatus]
MTTGLLLPIDPNKWVPMFYFLKVTKIFVSNYFLTTHSSSTPPSSPPPSFLVTSNHATLLHSNPSFCVFPSAVPWVTCHSPPLPFLVLSSFRSFKVYSPSYSNTTSKHSLCTLTSKETLTQRNTEALPSVDLTTEVGDAGTDFLSVFLQFINDDSIQDKTLYDKYLLFSENFYHRVLFPIEVYNYLFSRFEKTDFHFCNKLYHHLFQRLHHTKYPWSRDLLEAITLRFIKSLSYYPQHNHFLRGVNHVLQDYILTYNFAPQTIWDSLLNTILYVFIKDLTHQRLRTIHVLALELVQVYKHRFPTSFNAEHVFVWELRIHSFLQHHERVHAMYETYVSSPLQMSTTVHNAFIQAFARMNEFQKAIERFQQHQSVHPLTLESAYTLLMYCARQKDVLTCKSWLDTFLPLFEPHVLIAQDPPSFNLYLPFIECCREALTYQRFDRFTMSSYSLLTYRWKVAELFMQAVHAMERLGMPKDQQCYESMLTCYTYANYDDYLKFSISKTLQVFVDMKENGVPLSPYAFQTVMRAFANTSEPLDALERPKLIEKYMDFMRQEKLLVDARTYSIYFYSYLHVVKEKSLPSYTESLLELKAKEEEMLNQGIQHTHESLHALMRVYGAMHAYEKMQSLFDAMPSMGLIRTEETYFTMFHGASSSETNATLALDTLLPFMEQDQVAFSNQLMHTLFHCCTVSNHVALASELYEKLNTPTLQLTPTILNYLLKLSIRNRLYKDVQFFLDEFHRRKWFFSAATYYHLMHLYTVIVPNEGQIKALFLRIQEQMKLVEQFQHGVLTQEPLMHASTPLETNTKEGSSIPFRSKLPPSDESKEHLVIPPLLPLPAYDSPPDQHPIPILSDTRLYLKAMQMFLYENDLPNAVNSYSNILIDFHLCLLHRYAIAQMYLSNTPMHAKMHVTGEQMLSYPPRIVEYSPMNTHVGSLYLPEDIAKATWLLCSAILSLPTPRLPSTVPPVAYLFMHPPWRDSTTTSTPLPSFLMTPSKSLLQTPHRCAYLPLAHKERLYAARLIFQSGLRVLASYQDFGFMVNHFVWVKDLMLKLNYSLDQSLVQKKLVVLEDRTVPSYAPRSLLSSLWDTPVFLNSITPVWQTWLQRDRDHFQSIPMEDLFTTAKKLRIPTPTVHPHDPSRSTPTSFLMDYIHKMQCIKASFTDLEKMRVSSLRHQQARTEKVSLEKENGNS